MGNNSSRPLLLTPRPSFNATRRASTNLSFVNTSAVIITIVDVETGYSIRTVVQKDTQLRAVLAVFAKQTKMAAQELEMRIDGKVVLPVETVRGLDLKDGTMLEISRRAPVDDDQIPDCTGRRGPIASREGTERARSEVWKRFSKKCDLAMDAFGEGWDRAAEAEAAKTVSAGHEERALSPVSALEV